MAAKTKKAGKPAAATKAKRPAPKAKPAPSKGRTVEPKSAEPRQPEPKVAEPKALEAKRPGKVTPAPIAPAPQPVGGRGPKRTIFIDVENSSNEDALFGVLESLEIRHAEAHTELLAIGNWRTVGQRVGRRLALVGAQLVHSAPVTGVRDWSDLWIAVQAGIRLGTARPGDRIEIVSDDKAFDAVGDAAATLGVVFRRISASVRVRGRGGERAATERAPAPIVDEVTGEPAPRRSSRRRRGGRSGRGGGGAPAPRPPQQPSQARAPHAPRHPPAPRPSPVEEVIAPVEGEAIVAPPQGEPPGGATAEQLRAVITRLAGGDATRWVNLGTLENALKADGFSRPPGSQRLVTRLRHLDGIEVSPHGQVRLRGQGSVG